MEMLLALGISAIVLVGIGGVFFSAMRLRERTVAVVDQAAPMQQALDFLRRDLKGALPPGGILAGDFRCGVLGGMSGSGASIQFSTTSGVLRDGEPWGDVQEVTYEVRDVVRADRGISKELVRVVSRNLLATMAMDATERGLLEDVDSVEFACFDGSGWVDSWDSTLGETNLPSAVRVRIEMASAQTGDGVRHPIEMVVPLVTQVRSSGSDTTSTGGTQ